MTSVNIGEHNLSEKAIAIGRIEPYTTPMSTIMEKGFTLCRDKRTDTLILFVKGKNSRGNMCCKRIEVWDTFTFKRKRTQWKHIFDCWRLRMKLKRIARYNKAHAYE